MEMGWGRGQEEQSEVLFWAHLTPTNTPDWKSGEEGGGRVQELARQVNTEYLVKQCFGFL